MGKLPQSNRQQLCNINLVKPAMVREKHLISLCVCCSTCRYAKSRAKVLCAVSTLGCVSPGIAVFTKQHFSLLMPLPWSIEALESTN